MKIPKFETKKELFIWLIKNEKDLIYEKKSAIKYADAFGGTAIRLKDISVNKSDNDNPDEIKVRAIINTTMVRDSHKDVHLNGIWKKSLKENKRIKHIQEHQMTFDKIISDKDDLHAFTKIFSWKQLGFDYEGKTEGLVFDSNVKKSRNPVMFKEYKAGNVDNHSVGMMYVNIKLAINSKQEGDEKYKAEYDKWIDDILNKADVKKDGFFFSVYEAKALEGSAVPMGSNPLTPTLQTSKEEEILENEEEESYKNFLGIE